MRRTSSIVAVMLAGALLAVCERAHAQTPVAPHDHRPTIGWHLMQDGVVFTTYNHQGGSRGGDEFAMQNWWMGMARRTVGRGTLDVKVMFSLEPATLGNDGYREIFQSGETLNTFPLIDRQHPHDFLMQAAVVWRTPIGGGYSLTFAGAPVGEPALGPVPYMHRSSAYENPTAPLAHHTLDSTHISSGVVTAGIDRGPWRAEGSVFHGREPDEQRWDLMDSGRLDSWSVRGWYHLADWTFQVSHGFLANPEASEEGDVRRTTASASWMRRRRANRGWTAATIAYGRNNKIGGDFTAYLGEATHNIGPNTLFTRLETLHVEGDLLRFGVHGFVGGERKRHVPETGQGRERLTMLTIGGTRTVARPWGMDIAIGADIASYVVPEILKPLYGSSGPVSFHIFARVRPPASMVDHAADGKLARFRPEPTVAERTLFRR
jgi:hypothetical protein